MFGQSEARKAWEFSRVSSKLILPGESYNESIHQVWIESGEQFVRKGATVQLIKGQESVEIQQTKSW